MSRFTLAAALCVSVAAIACSGRTREPTAPPPPPPSKPRDREADARHVIDRFALGGESELVARVAEQGARAWVLAELNRPTAGQLLAQPATAGELAAKYKRPGQRKRSMEMEGVAGFGQLIRRLSGRQAVSAIESPAPVEDALVSFWFNHFNVYARKGPVAYLLSDYVDRALRPRVRASFAELLLATAQHPAMLHYLDNATSVREGLRQGRGLNENYARELLELHTLGVDGGYTQADVRATAEVLTGWNTRKDDAALRVFHFRDKAHVSGPKTVLGQVYPALPAQAGLGEGQALIRWLAIHPATASRIATKLSIRFVADPPPSDLVDALSRRYLETDGDLRAVMQTLVDHPSFWSNRGTLFKTPFEFVVSAIRTIGGEVERSEPLTRVLQEMSMSPFLCPPPTGYARSPARWANGAGMLARMRFAHRLAMGGAGVRFDLDRAVPPRRARAAILEHVLGGRADPATRAALDELLVDPTRERDRRLALAAALASPTFSTF